jgi:hypothetical protein
MPPVSTAAAPAPTGAPTVTNVHPEPGRRSYVAALEAAARMAGYRDGLMPWQRAVLSVVTAVDAAGRWAHNEAAVVVGRQNGKSSMIQPRVIMGLTRGERIAHAAHNRDLPRESFMAIARVMESTPALSALLAGTIRRANGQEAIRTITGGVYRVFSSSTEAIRGTTNDLVIVDEARELLSGDFMAAAVPTIATSPNPQIMFLSNAGHAGSVVLNELRRRGTDPAPPPGDRLAYIEYSAGPELDLDDLAGWYAANPAIGHTLTVDRLREFRHAMTAAQFDTECLCRWVTTDRPRLVDSDVWARCRVDDLGDITGRPALGLGVDPITGRVAAVLSWVMDSGRVALELAADHPGGAELSSFVDELVDRARGVGVTVAGFDPWTGADLVRQIRGRLATRPIVGRDLAAAAQLFTGSAEAHRLAHAGADTLDLDMAWLERRTGAGGSFTPLRGDRPAPAGFAAVYATWLATNPAPVASIS